MAFDLEGPESHLLTIPPAPTITSNKIAVEMAEVYWIAICRYVKFDEFDTNNITWVINFKLLAIYKI